MKETNKQLNLYVFLSLPPSYQSYARKNENGVWEVSGTTLSQWFRTFGCPWVEHWLTLQKIYFYIYSLPRPNGNKILISNEKQFQFLFFLNHSIIFLIKCWLIFSVLSQHICICETNKTLLEFLCSRRNYSCCLIIKDWLWQYRIKAGHIFAVKHRT